MRRPAPAAAAALVAAVLVTAAAASKPLAWGDGGHCGVNVGMDSVSHATRDRPEIWVQAHNHYRACHGAPPLRWNDQLAALAKAWAETLIQRCDGVEDMSAWVAGQQPGEEHRPHDPRSYDESPANGENIYSAQGLAGTAPEIEAVEGWYREVETQCPNRGQTVGCGGFLNHFTALIWKSATEVGCYTALRQTPLGPFKISDCRYAAGPQATSAWGCKTPNTVGCARDGQADGSQVPALTAGVCPKASATPQGQPQPAPAGDGQDCVPKNSLGKCGQCLSSNQCGQGRYCCPFMKKCVADSSEQCFAPIAFCQPPCSGDIATCTCKEPSFPCGWAKPTCGDPPLSCPQGTAPPSTPPAPAPPPAASLAASAPAAAAGPWQLAPRMSADGTAVRVPGADVEVKVLGPGAVPLASIAAVALAAGFGCWAVRAMLCAPAPPRQRSGYGQLLH